MLYYILLKYETVNCE